MIGRVFQGFAIGLAVLVVYTSGCVNNIGYEPPDGGLVEQNHFIGNGSGFIYEYRDVLHKVTCWHVPGALSCIRDAEVCR